MYVSLNNQTNPIFKSKIKIVTPTDFKEMTKHLNPKKHEVPYPWQPENMKTGKRLFTTKIMDCISGLVFDNQTAKMFHLVTLSRGSAKEHKSKGFNIKKIQYKLFEGINTADENAHAFILGGFKCNPQKSKYNWTRMDKIKKIFKQNGIPYTILGGRKDVHFYGTFSIMYRKKEDTIYITNNLIDYVGFGHDDPETHLYENGQMLFHTYKKVPHTYLRESHIGSVEDYMKSQFHEVKLSEFDEWA